MKHPRRDLSSSRKRTYTISLCRVQDTNGTLTTCTCTRGGFLSYIRALILIYLSMHVLNIYSLFRPIFSFASPILSDVLSPKIVETNTVRGFFGSPSKWVANIVCRSRQVRRPVIFVLRNGYVELELVLISKEKKTRHVPAKEVGENRNGKFS